MLQIGKEKVKLLLFADNMVIHVEHLMRSTKKLQELITVILYYRKQNQNTKISCVSLYKQWTAKN